MTLPIEFVVNGHPVSHQARRRRLVRQWMIAVQSRAHRHWPMEEEAVGVPIMLTITYYYNSHPIDIDNLPKPILDALKDIVFKDDSQVTDLICRKRYHPDTEFVQIIVAEAPRQEVIG